MMVLSGLMLPVCMAGAVDLSAVGLVDVQLTVTDPRGMVVEDAIVMGFNDTLGLIWPPHERPQFQMAYDWPAEALARTNALGKVEAILTTGAWNLVATGIGTDGVPFVAQDRVEVAGDTNRIDLKPEQRVQLDLGVVNDARERVLEGDLYVRPQDVPMWLPVCDSHLFGLVDLPSSTPNAFLTATPLEEDEGSGDTAAVLVWDQMHRHGDVLRATSQRGGLGAIRMRGSHEQVDVEWRLEGAPGAIGTIVLPAPSTLVLSRGEWTIVPTYVDDGVSCRWTGQRCHIKRGTALSMLLTGVDRFYGAFSESERQFSGRLCPVDAEGRLLESMGPLHRIDTGTMVDAADAHEAAPSPHDAFTLRVPRTDDEGAPTGSGEIAWTFQTPFTHSAEVEVRPIATKTIKVGRFEITVPKPLSKAARSMLQEFDLMDARIRAIAGREMRVPTTEIRMAVDHAGASAAHSGRFIRCGYRWLGRTDTAMRHGFVHERVHNYDLAHGGLMELIVERARSNGPHILTGQRSKWNCLRRMNGLEAPHPRYQHTGLYLLLWEIHGDAMLDKLLPHDELVRTSLVRDGMTAGEAAAGLLGAILPSFERVAIAADLVDGPAAYRTAVAAARVAMEDGAVAAATRSPTLP